MNVSDLVSGLIEGTVRGVMLAVRAVRGDRSPAAKRVTPWAEYSDEKRAQDAKLAEQSAKKGPL